MNGLELDNKCGLVLDNKGDNDNLNRNNNIMTSGVSNLETYINMLSFSRADLKSSFSTSIARALIRK